MGDKFYGSEFYPNIVPGNGNLNVSAFGTLEGLWQTAAENGKRVNDVTIGLSYPPNNNLRPNLFRIGFTIGGAINGERFSVTFENRAGQSIDPDTLAGIRAAVS